MTILLTGGTGKTSVRLAQLLSSASVPFLSASRSGNPPFPDAPSCKFDWMDESTYENPFAVAKDIDKAYLISPASSTDPLPPMRAFIELAIGKGVKRFVLLTASMIEAGGPLTGSVHAYLMARGVEWCVVRPTWFMENLSQGQHRATIRDEGKIYSAAGNGVIPWVTAEDIAAVAYHGLVNKEAPNRDYLVLGPERLTYTQLAETLSSVLDREIVHVDLTEEELAARHMSRGIAEDYAKMLAMMDTRLKGGLQDVLNDDVVKITGRLPKTFRVFAEENKAVWQQ